MLRMLEPTLQEPIPPPAPHIPFSSNTVDVRVIDSTTDIHIPVDVLFEQKIKGHEILHIPSYSFLISHGSRHVLFDLGAREDLESLAPKVRERAQRWGKVEKNVAEILDQGSLNIKARDIEAVILSHHHWDHTGTMTSFPKSTELLVGPGFKDALLPAYPTNADSPILESDFEGRSFREVSIPSGSDCLRIGPCDAMDFFGDNSFYLLSTPGHAPGHLAALARTTPETFMLLAGDACHHSGEIRPTVYQPLPKETWPSPTSKVSACPGKVLQQLQYAHSATRPFYSVKPSFPSDFDECERSLRKIEELDAHDSILVAMAHDPALLTLLKFYPEKANNWREDDVKAKSRWLFLQDFRTAIEDLMDQ